MDLIYISDFMEAISGMVDHPTVREMEKYTQHAGISCMEHCLYVSYVSYHICRFLKLDATAAARAGLVHDLFLYDWHQIGPHKQLAGGLLGMHGFTHPGVARKNAEAIFELSDREKNIIETHMWPLSTKAPRYWESFIVSAADKFCAVSEVTRLYKLMKMRRVAASAVARVPALG